MNNNNNNNEQKVKDDRTRDKVTHSNHFEHQHKPKKGDETRDSPLDY